MGDNNNSGQKINPAWTEILNTIPQEFHHMVIPTLKKWDDGVTARFNEINEKYEPYKAFEPLIKNNIEADYAFQAVQLADVMQNDPAKLVQQVNEHFQLGYLSKEDAEKLGQPAGDSTDVDDLFNGDDIFKDPRVKAMKDTLDSIQNETLTRKQQEEQELAIKQFEDYLDGLEAENKDKNLPFDRDYVAALVSQGLSGEAAVQQFHKVLAATGVQLSTEDNEQPSNEQPQPPVVMGSEGSIGSGTPDGSVDFGSLSKNDLNAIIEQTLAQQAQSGQG